MARRTVRFVARNGKLVALYSDDIVPLLNRMFPDRIEYARFSHINPTPDGRHFQIEWVDPEVIKVLGESVTCVNGEGQPFLTKGQAERYEVALLNGRYFSFLHDKDKKDVAISDHDGTYSKTETPPR